MIDFLYIPPKPAIVRLGEPWEIRAHSDMARIGVPFAVRQAIIAELKRLQGARSSIVRAAASDLEKYARHPGLYLSGMIINPYVFGGGPVTYVNSASTTCSGTSASLTFDATGCNFLAVLIYFNGSGAPSSETCSFNSVSATKFAGSPYGSGTYQMAFYLQSPSSGSHTVSASWTNSASRGCIAAIGTSGGASTISGIQSATTGSTLTVTSTANSLVISGIATAASATLSGGTTPIQQANTEYLNVGYMTGSTSTSVSWSQSTTGIGNLVGFSVD